MLFLVRHGRPLPVPGVRPDQWDPDPAGFDDIRALRGSGRLPERAVWFSSPEPKAVGTAQLLTESEVGIVDDLREHVRDTTEWLDDFEGTVRRAFAQPGVPAYQGWEPLAGCRERTARAVDGIRAAHSEDEVVLVGHGTAWTVLASELTGEPPDLDRRAALQMPDVVVLDV